jgi:hypothetical protein
MPVSDEFGGVSDEFGGEARRDARQRATDIANLGLMA